MKNVLLKTDVYKLSHMMQYPEDITKVYSYLTTRSNKKYDFVVNFGLQYILKEYLSQEITHDMVNELLEVYKDILGEPPELVVKNMRSLANLGYIPLLIKSVPEGAILPINNVMLTVTNTHPDFAWVVGYFESLLLKVWNTCTVATNSYSLRKLVTGFAVETCDNLDHLDWQIHDFGFRGCSSEETAMLSGAAHLLSFKGTDTVPAVAFLKKYYNATGLIGASVPASEHSVICSYGEDNELDAFKRIIKTHPTGILSIVSDTYNLWNVLENFTDILMDDILAREGKLVFRPDSGDPYKILLGDTSAEPGSSESIGTLRILAKKFGTTTNSKGYEVLNPKVGLIYGDGMYPEKIKQILDGMKAMGFASSNLVFGVGGLLLQSHSRDDLGFAIKATYVEVNGESRSIMKDPITDVKKKSHKGFLRLNLDEEFGHYTTDNDVTELEEKGGELEIVFTNGEILTDPSLEYVRRNLNG